MRQKIPIARYNVTTEEIKYVTVKLQGKSHCEAENLNYEKLWDKK